VKLSQVGAQLYTVRDHLRNSTAFAHSIQRLKTIGYSAVELFPFETVSDQEIAKICADSGITIAAAHVPGDVLLKRPEAIVAKLRTFGAALAAYPFPAGGDLSSRSEVERLGDLLEQSAKVLEQAGLTLAYHNHAMEFARLDGEFVYAIIRQRAPALAFELDVYWAQYGGMNPERLIREFGSKLISLHLKDFGVSAKHDKPPFMTEVGQGNLDFRTLIDEAERTGCQWFIVEQDFTPGDPFESLERSFRYVHDKLVDLDL
jgi:sugar phosphate isomerase/epimerase